MNLEQVAQHAGVSHTAVSLALRGKPGVSEVTRRNILKIAHELGYERNGPASALVSGRTGLIGVVPGWTDPVEIGDWDRRMINGLGRVLATAGKNMVFLLEPKSHRVPSVIGQRYVDGAVFLMEPHGSVAAWMAERDIPMVAANFSPSPATDCVMNDDAAGVRLAIDHLASLGHRRIGYLNTGLPAPAPDPSSGTRLDAYLQVMRERNLDAPAGAEQRVTVEQRLGQLFDGDDQPTALLCFNDHLALEAISWLWSHGYTVPDQVSVVGIDDVFTAPMAHPPLTTIHLPFEEMGERAGELLLARIADPKPRRKHNLLQPSLVERASTARVIERK